MSSIFWGFIMIYFNFFLDLDPLHINLIPSFIGAYLVLKGLKTFLNVENEKAIKYARVLMIVFIVTYILDLFNISNSIGSFSLVFSLLAVLFEYLCFTNVFDVFKQLEIQMNAELNSKLLDSIISIYVILSVITILLTVFDLTAASFVLTIAAFFIVIILLLSLHTAANNYKTASE